MRKEKALKIIYLWKNMDITDRRALSALLELIRKNRACNGGLWVSDWRTASSHRWKATYKASVARRFGISIDTLELLSHYFNVPDFLEELENQYRYEYHEYQHSVNLHSALRWMYSYLIEDHRFIDKLEYYNIANREDELARQERKKANFNPHIHK